MIKSIKSVKFIALKSFALLIQYINCHVELFKFHFQDCPDWLSFEDWILVKVNSIAISYI